MMCILYTCYLNSWLNLEELEFGEWKTLYQTETFLSRQLMGLQQHCTKIKSKFCGDIGKYQRYALQCLWSEHAAQLLVVQCLLPCYFIINNTPSLLSEFRCYF